MSFSIRKFEPRFSIHVAYLRIMAVSCVLQFRYQSMHSGMTAFIDEYQILLTSHNSKRVFMWDLKLVLTNVIITITKLIILFRTT